MEYVSYEDVVNIHDIALRKHGGSAGIRDDGALISCVEQPQQTFFGQDLYPTIATKAAVLCYFLVENHPFVDANKRTAYVSMEYFLTLNGYELNVSVDEAEAVILRVASAQMTQEEFLNWVQDHIVSAS